MSEERNQREVFDGKTYRAPSRRRKTRRKSDQLIKLLKYLVVVIVTVTIVKLFKF